jgi:hypothetical protein
VANDSTSTLSWPQAYKAFLLDKDESILLKVAPLAVVLGAPEIIVSNVIPIFGEFIDVGGITLTSIMAFRTYLAVRKHR